MKFESPNFNEIKKIENSNDEYIFDINNYNKNDEEFQKYLERLKEENPSLYNEIINSISEKEYSEYYNNGSEIEINNKKIDDEISSEDEDDLKEESPGYDLYDKYKQYIVLPTPKKKESNNHTFKHKKNYIPPFDLYK
jgi:hypothetical protein